MRWFLPYVFGGLTATTFITGYLAWRDPPAPEKPSPTARDAFDLREQLASETARRVSAERRAYLWEMWAAIYRQRLADLGQPQSWPGPTISTTVIVRPPQADVHEPELIPAPKEPFPTREGQ